MTLNTCFLWPLWSTVDKCNPRIIKTLCFSTGAGRIRLTTRPGCSQVRCHLMACSFGWNPRPSIRHPHPAWGKAGAPEGKSQPHINWDRKAWYEKCRTDWTWTYPTCGEKVSERRGWKGSGQWHEFAFLTVRSTALLWVRVIHPCNGQGLHCNDIILHRQEPGSLINCHSAYVHIFYI